jgi:hypothetical protein
MDQNNVRYPTLCAALGLAVDQNAPTSCRWPSHEMAKDILSVEWLRLAAAVRRLSYPLAKLFLNAKRLSIVQSWDDALGPASSTSNLDLNDWMLAL